MKKEQDYSGIKFPFKNRTTEIVNYLNIYFEKISVNDFFSNKISYNGRLFFNNSSFDELFVEDLSNILLFNELFLKIELSLTVENIKFIKLNIINYFFQAIEISSEWGEFCQKKNLSIYSIEQIKSQFTFKLFCETYKKNCDREKVQFFGKILSVLVEASKNALDLETLVSKTILLMENFCFEQMKVWGNKTYHASLLEKKYGSGILQVVETTPKLPKKNSKYSLLNFLSPNTAKSKKPARLSHGPINKSKKTSTKKGNLVDDFKESESELKESESFPETSNTPLVNSAGCVLKQTNQEEISYELEKGLIIFEPKEEKKAISRSKNYQRKNLTKHSQLAIQENQPEKIPPKIRNTSAQGRLNPSLQLLNEIGEKEKTSQAISEGLTLSKKPLSAREVIAKKEKKSIDRKIKLPPKSTRTESKIPNISFSGSDEESKKSLVNYTINELIVLNSGLKEKNKEPISEKSKESFPNI